MVALTSSIFDCISSPPEMRVGNFPALVRPGPRRRGICLIILSEAMKKIVSFGKLLDQFLVLVEFLQ